jgi:hypothetical protein
MDILEYNSLAQAIDTTFGRASTTGNASHSVKATIVGQDTMKLVYACVVNLTTDREALQMKQRYEDESNDVIKKYITKVKSVFKEDVGKAISLKEKSSDISFEMINMNPFNRKRTALFRRIVMFDIT